MHGLSNRAIFNDLEGPQTQISRSGHWRRISPKWLQNYNSSSVVWLLLYMFVVIWMSKMYICKYMASILSQGYNQELFVKDQNITVKDQDNCGAEWAGMEREKIPWSGRRVGMGRSCWWLQKVVNGGYRRRCEWWAEMPTAPAPLIMLCHGIDWYLYLSWTKFWVSPNTTKVWCSVGRYHGTTAVPRYHFFTVPDRGVHGTFWYRNTTSTTVLLYGTCSQLGLSK